MAPNTGNGTQRKQLPVALFKQFREQAETALSHGHDVTFEWPRYSDSWKRKDVLDFFQVSFHID